MVRFYDIDPNYIKYLKTIDTKVPNTLYNTNDKFFCGVVLTVNGIPYYAPISHNTTIYRTSLGIYDEDGSILSTIRFSFMIPALPSVLRIKDFKAIRKVDAHYASLLEKEWKYCSKHESDMQKKAASVHKIGCNPKHFLYSQCCDFKKLESQYTNYTAQ